MTIKELIEQLLWVESNYKDDPEVLHIKQDDLLLKYIDSKKVEYIFNKTEKWYG